jgi:hypothetical protein
MYILYVNGSDQYSIEESITMNGLEGLEICLPETDNYNHKVTVPPKS